MNIYDFVVGQKFKQCRLEHKLSLREASKIFNLSKSSISAYENGTRGMSLETMFKMIEYYDLDPNQFLKECLEQIK